MTSGDAGRLPHDRGFMLWRAEEGTRWLEESIERWAFAMLSDDEVSGQLAADDEMANFTIISRQDGILAGAWTADYIIATRTTDVDTLWYRGDGDTICDGDVIAVLSGGRNNILMLERSILNLIGQLSGIATNSAKWSSASPIPVACTRKTTWGLLDKWAVHLGGGLTHRLSKRDACMLKENDLFGTVNKGNRGVIKDGGKGVIHQRIANLDEADVGAFLTIEVRSVAEAVNAATEWQDGAILKPCVIMLDNMGPDGAREVDVALREAGLRNEVLLEASGGILFTALKEWDNCGIDVISTSAINRGTQPHDFSLLVEGA